MAKAKASLVESTNREGCEREGCCKLQRLHLSDGSYEEVQTECDYGRDLPNVFFHQNVGHQGMYRVHLSKFEPCPSPLNSEKIGLEGGLTWNKHYSM